MQTFSIQNKRIYRSSSEDLSMLRPTFYSWRSAGNRGSYSKDIFGSATVQMGLVGNVGSEKVTMQILNERLASYLEKVRSLEKANSELEVKIHQVLVKKGPATKDYSHYQATFEKLRKEILEMVMSNANVSLQIDNAKLAADDYRVKYENELQLRQYVEADINALRKMLDDTNMARLHLENDVEGLKVELIELKKRHHLEVSELYSQINQSGVQVDVDAPKGQDLAKIMEEIRAKYEKIALKNQEELKIWHESKISMVQVQVSENEEALKEAKTQVSVSHRQMQTLKTELQSLIGSRASLEDALNETKLRYGMQVEQYNGIILLRESELKQLRDNIQSQTVEYQALFNIKMELEAEIATYRRLLDGEE
ncbi:keratin, type I cytoskeletal 18-like [Sinocyclocheilus grahami]|uniref:keratin, type I cytoskeletal 18-like n=1 Tax=Sinocyclocheilus grahami TaxID=75366 RepID=UPI0007ACD03E|nr:PREDICTED: keratin, type I cytoskeletal 18-like [Sinocyclocheilus grahami]XP_016109367.1 PREDICTED: keratin, type I cytoskeletal 18-like [Sinocyclocheilus grahami]